MLIYLMGSVICFFYIFVSGAGFTSKWMHVGIASNGIVVFLTAFTLCWFWPFVLISFVKPKTKTEEGIDKMFEEEVIGCD